MNLVALAAFAASSLVPAQPTSFETVNLRMTVDSCAFVPATVRVSQQSNVIRVTQRLNNCLVPGTAQVADVRLGAFPSGDYRVDVYATADPSSSAPLESIAFQVRDPAEIAVFPPPPRPLTDYSGLWLDMSDPGWGISLYQGPLHSVFGLLFVYEEARQPEWYSLQGGRWVNATQWTATIYRTAGPTLWNSTGASSVTYAVAGTATLDFSQAPGREGRAVFGYALNGRTGSRTIERMPLQ
jgi:hypothetical protein